jgi:hypothetical protein
MKSARTPACLMAAALALVLAACGGSGSDSSSISASKAAAIAARGLTPPGAQLKLGQPATVSWIPPTSKGQKGVKMQVAVMSIKQGSPDDLKGLALDALGPDAQGSTPYFVTLKLTALDDVGAKAITNDPSVTFEAFDDRGQQQQEVTISGGFKPCGAVQAPNAFSPGKAYETCSTYLLKGGGSIRKLQWSNNGAMPYNDNPLVWNRS